MFFFKYFTPISYWLLILLWLFVFLFYLKRIIRKSLKSKLFMTLMTILAIDAFRTLFESVYFGLWYTSLVGFIPKGIHDFLIQPQNVIFPKFFNLIAASLIIFIVLKRWVPEEIAERQREIRHTTELEKEIGERKRIQAKLEKSECDLLEAQELARIGHYVFHIKEDTWHSSPVLDNIFGINRDYEKSLESWAFLVYPEDRPTIVAYMKGNVMEMHEGFNREYRIVNRESGDVLWVHGIGHLKFDDNGELSEMFGTIQDITEHKKLVASLEEALRNVKEMRGLLPICSNCKDIRDDKGYWNQLEGYLDKHTDLSFSHSLCPKCAKKMYGNEPWYSNLSDLEDKGM